jgi:filamentous hemagglutinin family protein
MMKPTLGKYWGTTAAIIAMSPVLLTATVTAQPITAAQDGTNTVVLPNGQQFDITGGTQAGTNLFHSFQQFGLSQGQIANFLSQPNIQNILGRVVGGDPSVIHGLIQLTGGNSNLYIMNPAGVIFGTNASLNVPASFTATTANGIQVGNSWFGMNTIASDLKNLTGTPNAFAFTSPSTTIQNQTSGVIVNQGNLNVSQGKSITLVGGIVINTGTIASPNGNINIVAVPDGKYVRITPEGGVLSFDLPIATQQELGNTTAIAGIDLPKLLAGSGIVAPTKSGEAAISGNLTAANINVLANRYDTTQASLNATNIQQGWNFVFIDSTVKDYQTLLNGTNGGSSVTVINPDQYGIAQVTATLATVTGANSLHIVSEGDVGNFWLGKDFVSTENIARYANDLQAWKTALSPAANILLYACNLASGENGAALVQAVKHYTGREVAASTDLTGSSKLGGNWNLEYQTGKLNTGVAFSNDAQNSYNGRLATFTATNINDAGAGSLRQAIINANGLPGADDIRFDPTVFNGAQAAITLATTLAINTFTGGLTISGAFGASNVTVSGNNAVRVFNITGFGNTTFDSLRIVNGNVTGDGGGINNSGGGTVTLTNSTVSGNTSTNNGGGIFSNGALTLTNSTVSGNTAVNFGGGILGSGSVTLTNSTVSGNTAGNDGGGIAGVGDVTLTNSTVSGNTSTNNGGGIRGDGDVTLTNSTVSGNTATFDGGGIWGFIGGTITNSTIANNTADADNNGTGNGGGIFGNGGTFTIRNSIIAGNFDLGLQAPDLGSNVAGVGFTNGGNNLIGANDGFAATFAPSVLIGTIAAPVNPQLAPLANNGGTTLTHALLPNSPALNAGNNANAPVGNDQRGLPRIFGVAVDIGAFESQVPLVVATPTPSPSPISTPNIDPSVVSRQSPAQNISLPTDVTPILSTATDQTFSIEQTALATSQHQQADKFLQTGNITEAIVSLESSYISELEAYTGIPLASPTGLTGKTSTTPTGTTNTKAKEIIENIIKELKRTSKITNSTTAAVYPVIFDDRIEILVISPSGKIFQKTNADISKQALLKLISDFRSNLRDASSQDYLVEAQKLNDWIVKPIETTLQSEKIGTIVFVMDGDLRVIPTATLHDGEKFLVEKYAIANVPSFSLARLEERDRKNSRVLAMGLTQSVQGLSALPAVNTEINNIVSKDNAQSLLTGSSFINEDFTLKNMQAQRKQQDYGIIHLATHAQFVSNKADGAFIQFFDDRLNIRQIPKLNFDKPQVEMLTLSACETAVGKNLGLGGLSVTSGVRSVLASLWPVSDAGTVPLILSFYSRFSEAPSKSVALQKAQISIIRGEVKIENNKIIGIPGLPMISLPSDSPKDVNHPYFWSSFVLIGSWL